MRRLPYFLPLLLCTSSAEVSGLLTRFIDRQSTRPVTSRLRIRSLSPTMPRIDPSAIRGGKKIAPTSTTPTESSPATRSRAPAAPRSKTKPLIPSPAVKRSKPSKQPRTIGKGSIPRKSPEPEEDGEWDVTGVRFVSKSKEAPAVRDTPQSQERLAATLGWSDLPL